MYMSVILTKLPEEIGLLYFKQMNFKKKTTGVLVVRFLDKVKESFSNVVL